MQFVSIAPLLRALGPRLGTFYRDVHAEHGVRLPFEAQVARLEGGGAVERTLSSRPSPSCASSPPPSSSRPSPTPPARAALLGG